MRINLCTSVRRLQNLLLLFFFLFLVGTINAQVLISGRITLSNGTTPIPGVAVILSGSSNDITLTDLNGEYTFSVTPGGSYSVRPFADANPLNGVSTYDIVLVRNHLWGVNPFTDPYRIIAADVNDSQGITAQDTLDMRELILGITPNFPGGESWRFVRADYVFPNPTNPFPFPRVANFNNLTGNETNVDFLGIKLGDINFTVEIDGGGPLVDGPYFSRIVGTVLRDENANCANDPLETPLGDWLVVASGFPGQFVTNTREDGTYIIALPEGDYTVTLFAPNGLWGICTPPQSVQVGAADTITVPFTAQAEKLCPRMEVDLSTGFLRRCFHTYYRLQYCNKGTVAVEDASIELTLDPYLSLLSSSTPWATNTGNTYTFDVGHVDAGACSTIILQTLLSCDAELGQTHCSTAHIYPDTTCGPVNGLWDGSNLRVSGHCNGDEVEFTITNDGDDMTEPQEYVIIEDIMIQMVSSDPIQLNNGDSEIISVPANGSTWRLEIDQPANYPYSVRASAAVEGCGTNPSGGTSQGFVTLFPQDDAAYYIDEDCLENTGSFDPNDKQGFPKGVGSEHFIPRNEEIEYLVRFQNTGTDTAFTVMIRDTISSKFDLATLRPGASSHAYDFSLFGPGVAQFTFPNIMLPDSNVNEAASHGFVKFTISPKAGLPDGTQLENQAGIYFDFNEPVITNRTLHTIGENYLEVTNVVNLQPDVALNVFPNPARTEATFRLQTDRPLNGTLFVYDLQGREVKRFDFSQNTFKVNVAGLPSGHYVFRVDAGGEGVSTGKIMVEK